MITKIIHFSDLSIFDVFLRAGKMAAPALKPKKKAPRLEEDNSQANSPEQQPESSSSASDSSGSTPNSTPPASNERIKTVETSPKAAAPPVPTKKKNVTAPVVSAESTVVQELVYCFCVSCSNVDALILLQ